MRAKSVARAVQKPGRGCGSCNACCVLMPVAELGKPHHEACAHLDGLTGCMLYASTSRPGQCRSYRCAYLNGATDALGIDGNQGRPDRLGVMFDVGPIDGVDRVVVAWEVYPNRAMEPVIRNILRALHRQFSVLLIAVDGFKTLYLGPEAAPNAARHVRYLSNPPDCVVHLGAAAWESTATQGDSP